MPNLAATDSLILLICAFFMLAAGFSLKPATTGIREFMQAGRALPGWLCAMAMLGAGLGSVEVLGMGAAGARYGLASIGLFALGSIPAMLFTGLYLMPLFYGSRSNSTTSSEKPAPVAPRTIPDYLGLRFDRKTRVLSAMLFVAMSSLSAGIALFAMARVLVALHLFDRVAGSLNLPPSGVLLLAMALPAALVLAYVLFGGLAATMYNQAIQFCLTVAGLLPAVLLGLKKIGGWSGLKTAAGSLQGLPQVFSGAAQAGKHPIGAGAIVVIVVAGLVLGGATWCADFRLLQTAMAAKSVESARRSSMIAAAIRVFVPLIMVVPGLIAVGLPTPRTTIVIHNDNGVIYHEISVVSPAAEAGSGLVPAKTGADGKPIVSADGHAELEYAMATPNVLVEFLPTGLLGLGVAALLACLMSGLAASVTALSTVFTCDIFQALFMRNAADKRLLAVARWAALGGALLAFGAACAAMRFGSVLGALMLVFAFVNAPLFAVLLLGAFWKRATGHGAFAGTIAGAAAALLLHGLALPAGEQPGIHGGWIAALFHPTSEIALGLCMGMTAFFVSLLAAAAVSMFTAGRDDAELDGLVHSRTPRPAATAKWWNRPEAMAIAILLAAIVVSLIFV